jgi:hypothetical protein
MRVALATCLSVLFVACGASTPRANPLTARASFDLNCPGPELLYVTISDRSPKTYGVLGCGRRATYVERCDSQTSGAYGYVSSTRRCSWVIDGTIQPDPSTRPPAPSTGPNATPAMQPAP